MLQPLVSILVPIYHVEKFIERCARSLFEQTYEHIEYIFVDDCTPDHSIVILQQTLRDYPERVNHSKILHHPQNTGIAEVRNTLLSEAKGEYILFIDSDDWIEKNTVELLCQKAVTENADIVTCDFYVTYPDQEICSHQTPSNDYTENLKRIISLQINTYLVTMLTKRSLYEKNQIRFLPGLNISEDYIVCVKLFFYAQKIVSVPVALYHYIQYNPRHYSNLTLHNIECRLQAIREVDNFCREKEILPLVKQEIDGRKFIVKSAFLLQEEFRNFKKWQQTFPEADYAWKLFSFRRDYRFLYWSAQHHLFLGVSLILGLKKILKKLFHSKNDSSI